HLVRVLGVGAGVAHGAAGDGPVVVPAVAVGVAIGDAAWGSQEGHVDVQLPAADGGGPAAVAAEHHRAVHEPAAHLLRQLAPEAGGLDVGDDPLLDVLDEGGVDGGQGAGGQGQIFESHLRQLAHHLVDD